MDSSSYFGGTFFLGKMGEKIMKNKIVIMSSYNPTIVSSEAVATQRRIVEHFMPEGCDFIQIITEPMYAPIPILHNFIKDTDYEIYVFFDIDAIPLNKKIIPRMIKEAQEGKLIGCIGRNGSSHNYVPHCGMAFSKEIYEKCNTDFTKGKRYLNLEELEKETKIIPRGIKEDENGKYVQIDVGEKITFKCEEIGIPIIFLPVTHIEKVEWKWGDGFELGYGTTFENDIWHQCETWRGMDRFFEKCKEVEEKIKNEKIYDDRDYWSVPSASNSSGFNNLDNPDYKIDINIYPSHERLYEEIKKLEFDSILEVGCGGGKNLKKLQELLSRKKIQGCDINPIIIEKAKKFLGNIPVFISSAESIKLPDNSFDVVFTNGVLQHTAPKNIKSVISEINRVAKKYIIHSECCYSGFLDPKAIAYLDISKPTPSFNYNYKELYKEIGLDNFQWLVDNTKGKSEMESISIMIIKKNG